MRATLIFFVVATLVLATTWARSLDETLVNGQHSLPPGTNIPVEVIEGSQQPKLIGSPRSLDTTEAGPTRNKRQILYGQYYTTEDSDLEDQGKGKEFPN